MSSDEGISDEAWTRWEAIKAAWTDESAHRAAAHRLRELAPSEQAAVLKKALRQEWGNYRAISYLEQFDALEPAPYAVTRLLLHDLAHIACEPNFYAGIAANLLSGCSSWEGATTELREIISERISICEATSDDAELWLFTANTISHLHYDDLLAGFLDQCRAHPNPAIRDVVKEFDEEGKS
jgi:hypothetical protein